jgi:uridine kinase
MDKKNKIIVITGPSGSGKTEIYKKIKNLYNDKSNFSFKEELGAKL